MKLLRVTARIILAFRIRSLKAIASISNIELVQEAETYLIRIEERKLQSDWKKAYRRLGRSIEEGIIIFVGEIIGSWLKQNWNQNKFILLPSHSKVLYYTLA